MVISTEIVIQFVMYGLSIGIIYGTIRTQLTQLSNEVKQLREDHFEGIRALRLDYKEELQTLRKEVEKHNRVIERTFSLEADVKNIKERLQ